LIAVEAVAREKSTVSPIDLLALDEALSRLAVQDSQQARVVELRYFGGLTLEEVATEVGTSLATVKREWAMGKAWLFRELNDAGDRA
jgi:DNA-directed RNA polymerase specialized sigma24 family protein